ncbi:MAG: flagellar basal body L-ring protein FlgH [Bryobacteraceae bacterium]
MRRLTLLAILLSVSAHAKTIAKKQPSAIDRYIADALEHQAAPGQSASPGSLYTSNGLLANTSRDLRGALVDDIVTIVVSDQASAVSKGGTNSARKSSVKAGVTAAYGTIPATARLANLAGASGDQSLQGTGETTRANTLTTTLSARVTQVLPNGNLVLEATKNVSVNSENQSVNVRGVVRPVDVTALNTVRSDQVANLEVRINGQGVVGDAIKRPFILYRILLGLLPF